MVALKKRPEAGPEAGLPEPFAGWFASRGWRPHAHQLRLLDLAGEGRDTLLIAPTGGGKTLAGFLPSLADLTGRGAKHHAGIHTLYVSPLKALAVDIARNLAEPVAEMGLPITLETRTGDTPASRRQRQRLRPPDILLTTPEQIALMLSHRDAASLFGSLRMVIIDELHAPLLPRSDRDSTANPRSALDAAVLLNAVQNMEGEREDYPLGVIGAGLPETKAYLTRAATFGERTHEMVLRELDEDTARQVLTEPARSLGVTWSPDALAAATRAGGGYPQSLQTIGAATWDAAQPDEGATITLTDLQAGRTVSDAGLESLFRARWEVATAIERAFLQAMARHTDTEVDRATVAAELGVDTDALGMHRRSLISKGIIEAPRHGSLRFTIPGFAAYVRSLDDSPSAPAGS